MTLSLEKHRIYPVSRNFNFRPNYTYQYPHLPPFSPRSSDSMTIPNYMLDGSDFTFGLMEFSISPGGGLNWGFQIDLDNAYYRLGLKIENGVMSVNNSPVNYYGTSYAMGYHYTDSIENANIYTRRSTNLTTRVRILNLGGTYSRQIVFAVALNGPTAGDIHKFQTIPAIPFPPVPVANPYIGGYNTYYLPDHPSGAPDTVYYGIVSLFGGQYITLGGGNPPTITGGGIQVERMGLITEVINKDSGLPP